MAQNFLLSVKSFLTWNLLHLQTLARRVEIGRRNKFAARAAWSQGSDGRRRNCVRFPMCLRIVLFNHLLVACAAELFFLGHGLCTVLSQVVELLEVSFEDWLWLAADWAFAA